MNTEQPGIPAPISTMDQRSPSLLQAQGLEIKRLTSDLAAANLRVEGQEEEHQRELERLESIEGKAHLQTIDERDRAEEALSQAYFLVTGRSPEWSNLFGHDEAIEDIDDAQKSLRAEIKTLEAKNAALKARVEQLSGRMPKSCDHGFDCGDICVYELCADVHCRHYICEHWEEGCGNADCPCKGFVAETVELAKLIRARSERSSHD
jgi:hypothetical protein